MNERNCANNGLKKRELRRLCYVVGYGATQDASGNFLMPRFALRLIKATSSFFPEVTLITPGARNGQLAYDVGCDIDLCPSNTEVMPLPSPRSRVWRWCQQLPLLWRLVADADLVCANVPEEATVLTALVCRLTRKPLMIQVLTDWPEAVRCSGPKGLSRMLKAWLADRMVRFSIGSAQLVLTQGRELFDKYARDFPKAVKASVVHSTLDDDVFCEKERTGFQTPVRLLSVCALLRLKGLDHLLRALRILLDSGLNVEWHCVGRGPLKGELERLARAIGVRERVRFIDDALFGPVLFRIYRDSDIFVFPSLTEGTPNAMLEAMANSLPIIASHVGGIPDLVREGVEGYLVPPANPPALAEAIAKIVANPGMAAHLGANGYHRAMQFHLRSLKERNRALIESVVGEIETSRVGEKQSELTPAY